MKKTKFDKLAEVLPKGIDQSVLESIATVVSTIIDEEVREQTGLLEAKVSAFIKTHVERLKEHAIKELEFEDERFRNSQLFDTVRSIMALEVNEDDNERALRDLVKEGKQREQELEILTEELTKTVTQLEEHAKAVELLNEQVSSLEKENKKLLTESRIEKKAFKSSEKGIVIVRDQGETVEQRESPNEFLNESILELCK